MAIFVRKLGGQGGFSYGGAVKLKKLLDGEQVKPPKSIRAQMFGDSDTPRQGAGWGAKRFDPESTYKLVSMVGAGASEKEVFSVAEKLKPRPAKWIVAAMKSALKAEAKNLKDSGTPLTFKTSNADESNRLIGLQRQEDARRAHELENLSDAKIAEMLLDAGIVSMSTVEEHGAWNALTDGMCGEARSELGRQEAFDPESFVSSRFSYAATLLEKVGIPMSDEGAKALSPEARAELSRDPSHHPDHYRGSGANPTAYLVYAERETAWDQDPTPVLPAEPQQHAAAQPTSMSAKDIASVTAAYGRVAHRLGIDAGEATTDLLTEIAGGSGISMDHLRWAVPHLEKRAGLKPGELTKLIDAPGKPEARPNGVTK